MQQAMAGDADQLRPVPGEEVSGGQADPGRVGEALETDGATLALVAEHPAKTEEADQEDETNWILTAEMGSTAARRWARLRDPK